MSGSALHIMVVVEPDRATYLDWPSLRREAVERGAMISLLEISESGPRWVVPVGPPGEGAEVPAVARDSGTVATGSGPAIIGKAFEAQASAPTIQTTEIRLLGGEPIERELASSLKKVAAISMTVFDNGAFRPSRSADPAPAPIQARDAPGMMPPPPPPPVPAGESSPGAVAQARTAPATTRGRTGLRRGGAQGSDGGDCGRCSPPAWRLLLSPVLWRTLCFGPVIPTPIPLAPPTSIRWLSR